MFKEIAVVGLGLLGGSFCKVIKKNNPCSKITAIVRTPEKLKIALDEKVIDYLVKQENLESGFDFSAFDLIIVSVPVEISIEILKKILNNKTLNSNAIVIDLGSVKYNVVDSLLNTNASSQFIGCHPMAGSEKTGYLASTGDLFNDTNFIITPHEKNKNSDVDKISKLWSEFGAKIIVTDYKYHDIGVCYSSHIPHILSSALVNLVKESGLSTCEVKKFIGPGFRDMSRLASGSVEMWREIIALNKKNISNGLNKIINILTDLNSSLNSCENNDESIVEFLQKAVDYKKDLD